MKINEKDRKEEEDERLRKGWRNIKIGQQQTRIENVLQRNLGSDQSKVNTKNESAFES